jgi:hypothetical protein
VSSRPTVVVQLSDPHIGATWAEGRSRGRAALADVVRRHPNLMLIIPATCTGRSQESPGGRRVLSAPSPYIGFGLDFAAEQIDDVPAPPGYVVHGLRDGELASHVIAVPTG